MGKRLNLVRYPRRPFNPKHPSLRGASVTLVLATERALRAILTDAKASPAEKLKAASSAARLIASMNETARAAQEAIGRGIGEPKDAPESFYAAQAAAQADEEPGAFDDWTPPKPTKESKTHE